MPEVTVYTSPACTADKQKNIKATNDNENFILKVKN
jgi:hypothetical protein